MKKLRFVYLTTMPNVNPVAQATVAPYTTRTDYVVSGDIVNAMNALQDPRRAEYFTTVGGEFIGGYYGFANQYPRFSHLSTKITQPDFEALLLDYAEVEFLLAEAVERGFAVEGTAEEHYESAITASMDYWGVSESAAAAYLARTEVAYTTATGDFREKIGVQKWIALFNRGIDAWIKWRRLDYPQLTPAGIGTAPPGTAPEEAPVGLSIPRRLIYPVNGQTLNNTNWQAAADAIGVDNANTKLFWDKQ